MDPITLVPNGYLIKLDSVVVFLALEVALLFTAYRAFLGRVLSTVDISAVTALPFFLFAVAEHSAALDTFKKLKIALLVTLFHSRHKPEMGRDSSKKPFFGDFRKFKIHVGPFFVFTGGFLKIACGVTYGSCRIGGCDFKHPFVEITKKDLACTYSCSAVSRNMAAICS